MGSFEVFPNSSSVVRRPSLVVCRTLSVSPAHPNCARIHEGCAVGHRMLCARRSTNDVRRLFFRRPLQISLHRFLHDLLQWYTVLGGDAAAVLVFGRVALERAVQACDLNADFSVPDADCLPTAGGYLAAVFAATQAKRSGFRKNDFSQIPPVFPPGQNF